MSNFEKKDYIYKVWREKKKEWLKLRIYLEFVDKVES